MGGPPKSVTVSENQIEPNRHSSVQVLTSDLPVAFANVFVDLVPTRRILACDGQRFAQTAAAGDDVRFAKLDLKSGEL